MSDAPAGNEENGEADSENLHRTGRVVHRLWEIASNGLPIAIAGVLGWKYGQHFIVIGVSVGIGTLAVGLAILPALFQPRDKPTTWTIDKMQPLFDRWSWILMAAVLLLSAMDLMSHAFTNHGIPHVTREEYTGHLLGDWTYTGLDGYSLVAAIVTIVSPWLFGVVVSWAIKDDKKLMIIAQWLVPTFMAVAAVLAHLYMTSHPAADVSSTWRICAFPPDCATPFSDADMKWAAFGIAVYILGYFTSGASIFQLLSYQWWPLKVWYEFESRRGDDIDLWLRQTKALVFETVVLPPLIVSAAFASGSLEPGKAAVYGLFVYSGFSVWNISLKIVKGASNKWNGLAAILCQFLYSLLMTVMWSIVLSKLAFARNELIFSAVLRVVIAAILIQYVFGPVYRNAYRQLSDRWLLEGPEYAVISTVVCMCVSAMPVDNEIKWVAVSAVLVLFIFVPAHLLRRSLTAYVLIRTMPGRTEVVRKALTAAEVSSAVVYGDYDLLAKIELPGSPIPLIISADADARNLSRLANLVKSVVRESNCGVRETETLVDCSEYVQLPRLQDIDSVKSGAAPAKQRTQ